MFLILETYRGRLELGSPAKQHWPRVARYTSKDTSKTQTARILPCWSGNTRGWLRQKRKQINLQVIQKIELAQHESTFWQIETKGASSEHQWLHCQCRLTATFRFIELFNENKFNSHDIIAGRHQSWRHREEDPRPRQRVEEVQRSNGKDAWRSSQECS